VRSIIKDPALLCWWQYNRSDGFSLGGSQTSHKLNWKGRWSPLPH